MKLRSSPLLLAFLIASIVGAGWGGLSLLNPGIWIGMAIVTVSTFSISLLFLEIFIYQRLRVLNQKVLTVLKRRTHQDWNFANDSLDSLIKALIEISTSVNQEIRHMRQVDLLRKEYIGEVSHELKTPIFAIQGYLETLQDGALDDPVVNKIFIRKALNNVTRLNNLVHDLLTITQIESGELKMNKDAFRIYEVILDVIELLNYEISIRQVKISFKSNNLENCYVWADKHRIQQVVHNLISNAVKYGKDAGGIEIELKDKGAKLAIQVKDNGPGISEEHLPHIFDRFYRIDKSRARQNGGTGLGLSIVKNIIEAHGETILVKSMLNAGTTFSFDLEKAY